MYRNGDGGRIGRLLVEEFGQNIPRGLREKIIRQFEQLAEAQFEAFRAHSEFVGRISHLDDIVRLEDIRARTMIVNGEHDTLLNLEDIAIAKQRIPDCESTIVKGVGHFLHFEDPAVLGLYRSFFLS